MPTLVLLRHGESQWNSENRFTGWTDVDLTDRGMLEARDAGKRLTLAGYSFEKCFTSVLIRAIKTLHAALEEMNLLWLPEEKSWRLNERHYGALQGLNKLETARQYGTEQVSEWRRSWRVRPPLVQIDDLRHPGHDPRYAQIPMSLLPAAESLKDTVDRVLPYWLESIAPALRREERVLVVAHGNSLRGLAKVLTQMSGRDIEQFEIPTAQPFVYELDASLRTERTLVIS